MIAGQYGDNFTCDNQAQSIQDHVSRFFLVHFSMMGWGDRQEKNGSPYFSIHFPNKIQQNANSPKRLEVSFKNNYLYMFAFNHVFPLPE